MISRIAVALLTIAMIKADMWFPDPNYKPPRKQWALLVASSNGWYNYRHQADVCHAYHTLIANGIPAENIITMMYDDIAHNIMNPKQGVIQNSPGGPNVYEGVVKDYVGNDVNVKNFFNILSGNKEEMKGIGSSRVIESGPEDYIFINLVDHGSTGVLLFPNNEYMYAKDFVKVLRNMRQERRFSKLVIYLEACEAGSMFDNMIDDRINVYVMTASAPDESSYAYYCENDMNICLGDMYSAVWMENVDSLREGWSTSYVSLFKQYRHVRTNVNKSHVMVYGDFRLGFDKLSDFIGDQTLLFPEPLLLKANTKKHLKEQVSYPVMSRDVRLHSLRKSLEKSMNGTEKTEISKQLYQLKKNRKMVDDIFDLIITKLAATESKKYLDLKYLRPRLSEEIFPCYQEVLLKFNTICFNSHQNPYMLNHFYKLANICHLKVPLALVDLTLNEVCGGLDKNTSEIF